MHHTFVAVAVFALALPSAAQAHATLEIAESAPGSYYKAVVRIAHGCDGAATHTVRVTVPEGVISVKPMPKPGWEIDLEEADYQHSYELHGSEYASGVRTITWTGGSLPDNFYDEFVFRGRLTDFPADSVVHFPVTQECDQGEIAWSEIPAAGQDPHDLDRPAPSLRIVVAQQDDGAMSHGAVAQDTMMSDPMVDGAMPNLGDLVIESPWARATSRGARVGGAFLTVRNAGHHGDRLIAAETDVAARVQLHTTLMEDGVMRMRHVEDGIEVPAGGMAELMPGGLHIMMMGLTAPLQEGSSFPVTLTFERAGSVTIDVPVRAAGAMDAGMTHSH